MCVLERFSSDCPQDYIRVTMARVNHMFPVNPAMSHTGVLYHVSCEVLWFLTKHPSPWYMDVHYGACSSLNPCRCCHSRKKRSKGMPKTFACQFCKAAWRLSAVSKAMSLCVALSGRNVPRWRVIERLRALDMMQSVRANLRREAGFQCGVSGYQPHWYSWPSVSSGWEWHGSHSSWSMQDWRNWHEWQQWCRSSYSPPQLYWHTLDWRTPDPFRG